MFKYFKYRFALDLLWIAICGILAFLFLFFIQNSIDKMFYSILFLCIMVALIYFRWILFPTTSFIFDNVLIKVLLWLANFPFVYFLLQKFNYYIEKIDDYAINFNPNIQFPLVDNLSVNTLLWIKNITLLSFISVLFFVALMQLRIMWLIMRSIREKYTKDSGY